MGFKRGNFMGAVTQADALATLIQMGLSEKESNVAILKNAQDLEKLISDLKAATRAELDQWREEIQGDPLYTMTPDQYAKYVAGQQDQAASMRQGETARLFDVFQARKDPEYAKIVDQYGGLTEYGANLYRETHQAGGGKKGLIIIGAIMVGLVAVVAIKRKRK